MNESNDTHITELNFDDSSAISKISEQTGFFFLIKWTAAMAGVMEM